MPVPIRTTSEIDAIARAGEVGAGALRVAFAGARPGATTAELDRLAAGVIRDAGARAVFKGLPAGPGGPLFPASICVCVNDQIVHGIPASERRLEPGDLLTIDVGVELNGWCADMAWSRVVPGGVPEGASGTGRRGERLASAARAVVASAVGAIGPGVRWSAVSAIVQSEAERMGFDLIPGFAGHGLGRALHEPPRAKLERPPVVPGSADDFTLRPGMVLTVEPILVEPIRVERILVESAQPEAGRASSAKTVDLADGWTVATGDGRWACYEERAVAVVRGGARVLTPLA